LIKNTSSQSSKTISILGQGKTTSVITDNQTSRVFDVVGTTSTLSVVFQKLSIEGGYANNNGGLNLPGTAVGGGLLIDGGNVTMSSVSVKSNLAAGASGTFGSPGGGLGGAGNTGGDGGKAQGGGFYLAGGSLTLNSDTFSDNRAQGGTGGVGGVGGPGYTFTPQGFATGTKTGGSGGAGGQGGVASGGGGFVALGTLVLAQDGFDSNQALGGIGGKGGSGGQGGFFSKPGGPGGNGGAGGQAKGGGLYIAQGTISLTGPAFDQNSVAGGKGGVGRPGGPGGPTRVNGFPGTAFGSPGITGKSSVGDGGGVYVNGGAITWSSGTIEKNTADLGAGMYNAAVLGIANITIQNNAASTAGTGGGGIWNAGTLTLTGVTLTSNSAKDGGGIYNKGTLTIDGGKLNGNLSDVSGSGAAIYNSGPLNLEGGLVIESNFAGISGGAIYNPAGDSVSVTDTTFASNQAAQSGGGIFNLGTTTLTNSVVEYNSAPGLGATGSGVWNSGTLTVTGTTFTGNGNLSFGGEGGGIYNNGSATVVNSTFGTNMAFEGSGGGGIFNDSLGVLVLTDSTLSDNSSINGGGLFNQTGGSATITGSTFDGNSATKPGPPSTGFGGGVLNDGQLTITNSTFANNSAAQFGGAIGTDGGTLTLIYVTVAYNSVLYPGSGGGIEVSAGSVTLYNSLVALNTNDNNGVNSPDDIATSATDPVSPSSAYNLIGSGGSGGLTNGTNGNIVVTPGTALDLGQLADNGGLTETIALLAGSPAIGAGSAKIAGVTLPLTDQRGILRGSSIDVGAYQIGYGYLVTNTADSLTQGTLRSAVAFADSTQAPSPFVINIVFDTAGVFATAQTITLTMGTLELSNTTTPIAIDYTGTSTVDISGGGAFQDFYIDSDVTVTFTDLTISGGSAASGGAGGGIANFGNLTVIQSLITDNTATAGGGIYNNGTLHVIDTTFSSNQAGSGGALYNVGGLLNVQDSIFSNNTASGTSASSGGGGIFLSGSGSVAVSGSSFLANAGNKGGGIFVFNGSLTISAGTITGNTATTQGGGIENLGTLNLLDSALTDNSANGGGGVDNPGTATFTNSTFTGNSATGQGGGIQSEGTLTLVDDTIAANSVAGAGDGGGLDVTAGSAILGNTIVALNTNGSGASDISGRVSGSYNLIGAGGSGGLTNGSSGNQTNVTSSQLNLAPLGAYGGPTETMALQMGSIAIDAGATTISGLTVPNIDQRGALRGPAGLNAGLTVDIGAYEASSSFLVTNTLDSNDGGTLRTAVGWANVSTNANPANVSSPAPNTIVFDTNGVFSTAQTITLSPSLGPLALDGLTTAIAINGPVANNLTIDGGGAVGVFSVASSVTASLSNLVISHGSATSGGGINNSGTLAVSNSTLSDNSATSGGGMFNSGTVTITNSSISNNSATSGGGIFNNGGAVTISTGTLATNTATASGGGIDSASGSVTISYTTLSGNTAGSAGGGIENGGTLVGRASTIAGNSASTTGGGIDNLGGTVTLTNDTIANNVAQNGGGVSDSGALSAINVTIASNQVLAAGAGGGLYILTGGFAILDNTIVALNTLGSGSNAPANDIALGGGLLASFSAYNLIGTGGSGGLVNGVNGNLVNVASSGLFLGTLADNGGPTQTIALLAGSPAIDGGGTTISGVLLPTLDQRGALRGPAGLNAGTTVDIGAYEASSSYLVTTAVDSTGVGSLREAIDWTNISTNANPENVRNPAPNTVVFDTAGVFATPQIITLSATLGTLVLSNTNPAGVAINGPGQGRVTISGANAFAVFMIDPYVTATLSGLTITGGSGTSGGGIVNDGTLTVNADTVTGNAARTGGGIENIGTLNITYTTISDNTAGGSGGGIDNSGALTLTNDTIADNTASTGGGISTTGSGGLTAVNITIAYNHGSGGGIDSSGGPVIIDNTIVALNTDGTVSSDILGTVSGSYNLIGVGGSGGLTTGVNGNQVGVANPGFVPNGLQNNGGPTETIALLPNSPAIQTGRSSISGVTVPKNDQRGALRNPEGLNGGTTVDIGAYELSSNYQITSSTDSFGVGTLRAAIAWANLNPSDPAHPLPNTISFDPAVFSSSSPQVITLSQTFGTLELSNTTSPTLIDGPGASVLTISGAGVVGVFLVDSGATATVSGLTITNGTGSVGGAFDNSGNLTVTDSTLANNGSTRSGGAIYNNLGTLTITDTTLSNNSTLLYGGAVYNYGGTVTISGSTFEGNSSASGIGGGIDNTGFTTTTGTTKTTTTGSMTITNSTILNNSSFYGGGINNSSTANLTISNTTVQNNTGTLGGGIWNDGMLTVTASTIANNLALAGGGISNNLTGTLMLVNSTIAGNTATQYGGGIDNVNVMTAVNDTIAYNIVASGGAGGGLLSTAGTAALYNTIVANNYLGTAGGSAGDISGSVATTSSFNLIGIGGAGGLSNAVNGNQVAVANTSTTLGKLANNGGPTETIALLTGSTAIGAGSSSITGVTVPSTDQRGEPRPAGSIDIGAYQTQPVVIIPLIGPEPTVVATKPLDQNAATPVSAATTAVAQSVSTSSSGALMPGGTSHAAKKVLGRGRPRPNGGSTGAFHKSTHKVATNHFSIAVKHVNFEREKK
jgi:predicted outer membrane repeat protein